MKPFGFFLLVYCIRFCGISQLFGGLNFLLCLLLKLRRRNFYVGYFFFLTFHLFFQHAVSLSELRHMRPSLHELFFHRFCDKVTLVLRLDQLVVECGDFFPKCCDFFVSVIDFPSHGVSDRILLLDGALQPRRNFRAFLAYRGGLVSRRSKFQTLCLQGFFQGILRAFSRFQLLRDQLQLAGNFASFFFFLVQLVLQILLEGTFCVLHLVHCHVFHFLHVLFHGFYLTF